LVRATDMAAPDHWFSARTGLFLFLRAHPLERLGQVASLLCRTGQVALSTELADRHTRGSGLTCECARIFNRALHPLLFLLGFCHD